MPRPRRLYAGNITDGGWGLSPVSGLELYRYIYISTQHGDMGPEPHRGPAAAHTGRIVITVSRKTLVPRTGALSHCHTHPHLALPPPQRSSDLSPRWGSKKVHRLRGISAVRHKGFVFRELWTSFSITVRTYCLQSATS